MAAVNELLWFFLSLALSPSPEKPTTQLGGWNDDRIPPHYPSGEGRRVDPDESIWDVTQGYTVTEILNDDRTPPHYPSGEGRRVDPDESIWDATHGYTVTEIWNDDRTPPHYPSGEGRRVDPDESIRDVTQGYTVTEIWNDDRTPPHYPSGEGNCNRDEEYSPCSAHCQKNCSNWQEENIPCPRICVPGCVCKEGKVRGPKGYCVRPQAECSEPNDSNNSQRISLLGATCDERCTAHCIEVGHRSGKCNAFYITVTCVCYN